ncbi:MAG TPA: hypothetical protein VLD55_08905 [Candidatus Sulfobium mesophilum]|nr:hypothetical protein [Candidatus Sulfobium mesophilum]
MSRGEDVVSYLNGLLGLPGDLDHLMGKTGTINGRDNIVLAMEVPSEQLLAKMNKGER